MENVCQLQETPKNCSSIGTEPPPRTRPSLTAENLTFTPIMSYGEKLLLQKNRRNALRSGVKSEEEVECDNTDLLIEAAKGELVTKQMIYATRLKCYRSILCLEIEDAWKMQEEPDMEMLYRLSQISGDQIRSSCTSGLNCSPVAKSLYDANEYVFLELLLKKCILSIECDGFGSTHFPSLLLKTDLSIMLISLLL